MSFKDDLLDKLKLDEPVDEEEAETPVSMTNEELDGLKDKSFWKGFRFAAIFMFFGFVVAIVLNTFLISPAIQKNRLKKEAANPVLLGETQQQKMQGLVQILKKYYYEDIDDSVIQDGIYSGIMNSVGDPYTCYYNQQDLKMLTSDIEGTFYGIGATLEMDTKEGYIKIVGIIDGSPASESDIQIGDYIIEVDGEDMYGLSSTEVVKRVRGDKGTDVELTLRRNGAEVVTVITREKIETPSVKYEMKEDGIAYIQITEFSDNTPEQFKDAKKDALKNGAKAVIIDLRGNPGGNLTAVTQIANEIIGEGMITYTEDKYGNRKEYKADGRHELKLPIAVLVNGNSASASEILAGAIKDHNKGTLIGTTTFGKGIVQVIIPLADGTAVKVTESKYYTPSGVNIHKTGIEPDEVLEFDGEKYVNESIDNQLERAMELLKQQIGTDAAQNKAA